MTTTEEVKEAGLRWQQHAKAEPGDDVAYLALLTDPPGAEGGLRGQLLLGEGPQAPPPANPSNPKKHLETPPPSGKGKAPSAVALYGGADVTGRYPSRRATLKRRKSSALARHSWHFICCSGLCVDLLFCRGTWPPLRLVAARSKQSSCTRVLHGVYICLCCSFTPATATATVTATRQTCAE